MRVSARLGRLSITRSQIIGLSLFCVGVWESINELQYRRQDFLNQVSTRTAQTGSASNSSNVVRALQLAYDSNYSKFKAFECDVRIIVHELTRYHLPDTIEPDGNGKFVLGRLVVDGNKLLWSQQDENGVLTEILSFDGSVWRRYDASKKFLTILARDELGSKVVIDIRNFGCVDIRQDVDDLFEEFGAAEVEHDDMDPERSITLRGKDRRGATYTATFSANASMLPVKIEFASVGQFQARRSYSFEYKPVAGSGGLILKKGTVEFSSARDSATTKQKIVYECNNVRVLDKVDPSSFVDLNVPPETRRYGAIDPTLNDESEKTSTATIQVIAVGVATALVVFAILAVLSFSRKSVFFRFIRYWRLP